MKHVLYFAENALSSIQGGGIVAYAVLRGLPPDRLLGFFDYRNITPVPEYADRFVYLGPWRAPAPCRAANAITRGLTKEPLTRLFADAYVAQDLAFVDREVARRKFTPEIVYFAGLSYRYLRLAVMAAEGYGVPMLLLNMDDWIEVERRDAGRFGALWHRRMVEQLTRASGRSLVSTTNSPRLAEKMSRLTGHRHVAANNCCSDMPPTRPAPSRPNRIPVITYAGAMNRFLQGETLKILASAVTELNAEGTRVHLHIYTPWEFAPEANAVAVPHAVFYKGQISRERLADVYRRSDFLATTVTHREGHISLFRHSLSTKLSEYLCAGKPVISMGHYDWHLHEYVQEHGCGFSILMDEHYSRAAIKAQLRRILSTDRTTLDAIGRNNRALWERAHDVTTMAARTRRAVGLDEPAWTGATRERRRGVLWVGDAHGWVPLAKAQPVARALVDVFELSAVDVVGGPAVAYPHLDALLQYCRDVGLEPCSVDGPGDAGRWDLAAARWSLDDAQRSATAPLTPAQDVFAQVAALRGTAPTDSPVQRAIAQLSVRIAEDAARKPTVWVYGSAAVGRAVLEALRAHAWLVDAVRIGGYLSSAGHCAAASLHGDTWRSLDEVGAHEIDFVVITSELSRLGIQEELSRRGLLDRAVSLYGTSARRPECLYERNPREPGQQFGTGLTAFDYASRELAARTGGVLPLELPRFHAVA